MDEFGFLPTGTLGEAPHSCENGGGCLCFGSTSPGGYGRPSYPSAGESDSRPGWHGGGRGVFIRPARKFNDKGKEDKKGDACHSEVHIYVCHDKEKTREECPNRISQDLMVPSGEVLDMELAGMLHFFETNIAGRTFLCPCRGSEDKHCAITFVLHRLSSCDPMEIVGGPEGIDPIPIHFDCGCLRIGGLWNPPGRTEGIPTTGNPGNARIRICHPPQPGSPNIITHEIFHAVGLQRDTYKPNPDGPGTVPEFPEAKGTVMGDPSGTEFSTEEICTIARLHQACRRRSSKSKFENCCPGRLGDGGRDFASPNPITPPTTGGGDDDGQPTGGGQQGNGQPGGGDGQDDSQPFGGGDDGDPFGLPTQWLSPYGILKEPQQDAIVQELFHDAEALQFER